MEIYKWGDMFCGAGGNATGTVEALDDNEVEFEGWAVNHWDRAVETMHLNHPRVHTLVQDLTVVIPSKTVPGRHLDHLHASPSCTHHSRACGGRPRSDQLRAQPNIVLDWVDDVDVSRLSVENVPEFTSWGPLDDEGNIIKAQKGTLFDCWIDSLEKRNYDVDWRIINCADFGDATTRKRFFLKAVKKGRGKIVWPEPTHAKNGAGGLLPWKSVGECLDFADTGTSIFNRKKPLVPDTMERIAVGAKKFWGVDIKPFIVRMNRHCYAESIDDPCSTLTTSGAHHMLCTPIIVDHCRGGVASSIDSPIGTQMTHDRYSLVTPLVLGQQGGAACRPVTEPCPTIACGGFIRTIYPELDDGRLVDIHIRMLRPDELQRIHSFPDDYVICGNRCEKVKQIGNSVPVLTARAMMNADLAADGLAA